MISKTNLIISILIYFIIKLKLKPVNCPILIILAFLPTSPCCLPALPFITLQLLDSNKSIAPSLMVRDATAHS